MAHNVPSSPNQPPMHPMYGAYGGANGAPGSNGGGGGQAMYNGNHANGSHSYMGNGGIRDMAMGTSNGYNTNGNAQYPYGNTYMQRGNGAGTHGIGNTAHSLTHMHHSPFFIPFYFCSSRATLPTYPKTSSNPPILHSLTLDIRQLLGR